MTILDGCISLNSVQNFLVVLEVVDMCHFLWAVELLNWIWRKTSLENQIHAVTLAVKTFYCTSTSIQIYWLGNGVWSTCHFIFIVTITFGPICSKKIREREKEILHRNHHKVAIEHSIIEVTVLKNNLGFMFLSS